MELRVGLDLVSIAEVRRSIANHGEHYLSRVFTEREVADCGGPELASAAGLAGRFAAKEATIKALASSDDATPWADIEVVRGARGEPTLRLAGLFADIAHDAGLTGFSVSITHEGEYAAAAVIAYQTLRTSAVESNH